MPTDGYWTREQKWPDEADGPFTLRLTFALVNGRPEVVGVELWGADPAAVWGLTARESHKAGLTRHPRRATAIHTEQLRIPLRKLRDAWQASRVRSAEIARAVQELPEPRLSRALPPGYRKDAIATAKKVGYAHGDDHWRAVRDAYLRGGLNAVQKDFGVAKGTAGKWVWIVRHEKELLPKTSRGRATGHDDERRSK